MGMRFTNGYAPAALCSPTRKSILTGQSPTRHEYQIDQQTWKEGYRDQLTIPRLLKSIDSRYVTAHLGKWHSALIDASPEEMGYDISDGMTSNRTPEPTVRKDTLLIRNDPKLVFSLAKRTSEFIRQQHSEKRPFFVQLSHYAVHENITSTDSSLHNFNSITPGRKHGIPEFAAMTADLDHSIGILLSQLSELDLLKSTYVIVLSDNGGVRGIDVRPVQELPRNYPLRSGKGHVFEGGIRVPFFVVGPGISPKSFSDVPVSGLDILPTIADLAGWRGQLPSVVDGGSLAPVLANLTDGAITRNDPFLLFHIDFDRRPGSALRENNYKLVKLWKNYHWATFWKKDDVMLFDLSTDIGEEQDLSILMPERTRRMEARLDSMIKAVGASTNGVREKRLRNTNRALNSQ